MNKQKGLAPVLIIILIALAVGGYLLYQKSNSNSASSPVVQQTPQPSSSPSDELSNWKTYTNSTLGFSFSYPKELNYIYDQFGFNHLDNPEGNLLLQNYDGSKSTKDDPAKFQMEVDAYKNADQVTLEKYVKDPHKVWNINNTQTFTPVTLGNESALKGQSIQKNEKVSTVWVVHNRYILTIHLETPNSQNTSWFDQILSTFKFQ